MSPLSNGPHHCCCPQDLTQRPIVPDIDVVWIPGHASLPGNEAALPARSYTGHPWELPTRTTIHSVISQYHLDTTTSWLIIGFNDELCPSLILSSTRITKRCFEISRQITSPTELNSTRCHLLVRLERSRYSLEQLLKLYHHSASSHWFRAPAVPTFFGHIFHKNVFLDEFYALFS